MQVRYKVDFGGGARGDQREAVDAGAELDEANDAPDLQAAPQPQPVSRAARMLALAHHVERLVEAGELGGYAEAARVLGITRARVTQIMNLLLLAPEIQEAILTGRLRAGERSLRRVVREPVWAQQGSLLAP